EQFGVAWANGYDSHKDASFIWLQCSIAKERNRRSEKSWRFFSGKFRMRFIESMPDASSWYGAGVIKKEGAR
ncbi:MAG: hypothetical protein L0G95_12875, partial [Planococcus sp. (in: firmicutes)]|nr:hypothetical protein [Planococcus sp. (in: firmicutes)]